MPDLFIIAGCNGAGKTTASFTVLPEMLQCREFVNADEIARGLSPFQPEKVAIQAGRIMLNRIGELIEQQVDFAIETTLTTRSYMLTIELAKTRGYFVTIVFFWLNDVALAIERVNTRVLEGGHFIPEMIIRRRYKKGIDNFIHLFKKTAHFWLLVNNSENPFTFVAEGKQDADIKIYDPATWEIITKFANNES